MTFYELTKDDVGKTRIDAFGRTWPLGDVLGKVEPGDVGKRVRKVVSVAGDGYAFLQIENDAQRDARLADPARNARERYAQELEAMVELKRRHNAELAEVAARLAAANQAAVDAGVSDIDLAELAVRARQRPGR